MTVTYQDRVNLTIAVGRGLCSICGTGLIVVEHALAKAIPDEALAEAMRAVVTIRADEDLVVAAEDRSFECPVCAQTGRLHALATA